ncbi:ESCRT-1 complex, Vps28 subunit [Tuber magnatum]|uniref:Vacuolar protein sorting-associated protein 28 n=1 Tax=Tuber magnatum TaxID=42249 RepID=A0A317SC25_9PEZI|nr:ESCRT-1 complex, Vps28 subunit [Tuber magnatum]
MSAPKYQPYAPSPYSYTPSPHSLSTSISLDEEVKLSTTVQQRELNESLAEIYSIIVTLDFLEKAYIKDSISQETYTPTCLRLLGQYKTILKNSDVASAFRDLETFKSAYHLSYPSATERLKIGVPATFEHAPTTSSAISARAAAEATQNFITFMDALRLHYTAKDQLHPLLSDVITSVNNVAGAKEFEGRQSIVQWLIILNQMGAGDEITEAQGRQMLFDIENAYNEFYKNLQ